MVENKLPQLSLTDPESRLMKMNEGFGVCYNTQTAVDIGSHLVTNYIVTDSATDHGQITPVASGVKQDYISYGENEDRIIETIADKGYQDEEEHGDGFGKRNYSKCNCTK